MACREAQWRDEAERAHGALRVDPWMLYLVSPIRPAESSHWWALVVEVWLPDGNFIKINLATVWNLHSRENYWMPNNNNNKTQKEKKKNPLRKLLHGRG